MNDSSLPPSPTAPSVPPVIKDPKSTNDEALERTATRQRFMTVGFIVSLVIACLFGGGAVWTGEKVVGFINWLITMGILGLIVYALYKGLNSWNLKTRTLSAKLSGCFLLVVAGFILFLVIVEPPENTLLMLTFLVLAPSVVSFLLFRKAKRLAKMTPKQWDEERFREFWDTLFK